MAINLAIKYSNKIAEAFTKTSFVKQHTSRDMDFTGAKTLRVYKIEPVAENDYNRAGVSRYGQMNDVQDTVYEYTMTQDKAFTGVVDKGDESDQSIENKAGKFLATQLKQVSVPGADKYALRRFIALGKTTEVAAPSKTTVVSLFADAMQHLDDHLVPDDGRIAYVPGSVFKLIATSDEFIKIEALGKKSVARGEVGELFGFKIIKVPSSYMPTDCYFLAMHKAAGVMPYKISETRVHENPVGISGAVVEGRHYYDAFIMGEKADAVYAAVKQGAKLAAPSITVSGSTASITAAGAADIRYTTDGTDPRFSDKAQSVPSGGVSVKTGDKVRAVAFAPDGKFTSEIAQKEI